MKKYNINNWFIAYGTLLGIVRNNNCINYDDDIDNNVSLNDILNSDNDEDIDDILNNSDDDDNTFDWSNQFKISSHTNEP